MRHLDLFSGIGGFALATEAVWGKENVKHVFVENDPSCRAVLQKHWPEAKIYGDIRTFTYSESEQVDPAESDGLHAEPSVRDRRPFILTGGFPCQPFSQAGRRKGTADDRHLWPEMLRVIREFHPRWVIGENVGGLVTWNNGMVLEQVHADLEGEGYEVQAFVIPACAVNAPHRRDRIWIVANRENNERTRGGNMRQWRTGLTDSAVNDTKSKQTNTAKQRRLHTESTRTAWESSWPEVAARLCRVDDGVSRRMDRNPRLKALGNAIVPQVAEEIMRAIKSTP